MQGEQLESYSNFKAYTGEFAFDFRGNREPLKLHEQKSSMVKPIL